MSEVLRPGVLHGGYPERVDPRPPRLERAVQRWRARIQGDGVGLDELATQADEVIKRSDRLVGESEADLALRLERLRPGLRREIGGDPLIDALALVRERSRRELGMAHFKVQLMAGSAMLQGMLVELDTGEGKTLSATIPAAVAGLAGIPVHVITVNDYLVVRDADLMRPLYSSLGLSVGTVVDTDPDPETRRKAYACDITYVTNKQIAFDYLRDRLERPNRSERLRGEVSRLQGEAQKGSSLLLRGLPFAVVDEADSVLVDEARTPLILSRDVPAPGLDEIARVALGIADQLTEGEHYEVGGDRRQVELTREGRDEVAVLSEPFDGVWNAPLRRSELVRLALTARDGYVRDEDYIVREGKVEIVDASTGRSMPDRSWEGGLQQMIELKEGCELSGERETLARISYQQFYCRYLRLGGMTGTGAEVAAEIEDVYGLPMVRVPPRNPSRREDHGVRVLPGPREKLNTVVSRIRELHQAGRPVLVGASSVRTSEELGAKLASAGLPHVILNARQDAEEAAIIEQAGHEGRITIATSMAGRGSDIRCPPEVESLGGLHVLAVEKAAARRIDRQLIGRCARQGDAGSFEQVLCLDEDLPVGAGWIWGQRMLRSALSSGVPAAERLGRFWIELCQRRLEARHARERAALLRSEAELEKSLAFAGAAE